LVPWLRRSGWAYVAVLLTLAGFAWWISGDGESSAPAAPSRAAAPAARVVRAAPASVLVHVAGEVRRPGVIRLPAGARVLRAVKAAGGPTRRADLSGLNLAAPLQDGQQVRVPGRVSAAVPGAVPSGQSGPVSLSSATVEQLDALDGVGPTLAARIVAWRDQHGGFSSVEQLLDVPGIGEGRLEALRPHITP
jgi:competence protein ComEA